MELQHQLRMHFPNLPSHGMNHPATDQNALIAQIIGYVQMFGFMLLVCGQFIFKTIGQEPPELVKWMGENKMNSFCFIFMLSFVSTQLMATGAFEVYYNGNVVFSKLEQGRVPHVQDLIRNLKLYGVQPQMAKY